MTDNEVLAGLLEAARDSSKSGHDPARRIMIREHFKLLYQKNPDDIRMNPEAGKFIFNATSCQFGVENVRRDEYTPKGGTFYFPVLCNDGRITDSRVKSQVIQNLPASSFDLIFVEPSLIRQSSEWLGRNRSEVLNEVPGEE